MRNPNGYGCIKKLSGNRRRPYIFVVSEAGKRRILGHAGTNVTDGVYTHKNLRQLRKAILKIR